MKRFPVWSWLWLLLGILYFFLPLFATFEFSLRARRGVYSLDAYQNVLNDPQFSATFTYSVTMALATIHFFYENTANSTSRPEALQPRPGR